MSESLANLGKGLAEFNGEIQKIAHDGRNPQFRSKYVTLDALIDATKPILQKYGLSVIQVPLSGEESQIGVKSLLLHESGEFIESEPLFMKPMKMVKGGDYVEAPDAQAAGSTISYLRRYSYQAILNLSTGEDDDGESAVGRSGNSTRENTSEPSTDRSSRRERTETTDKAEESNDTNQEKSSTDEGSRRGRRSEEPKQEADATPTEETGRRGSRRSQEDTSSTAGDSENTSRRGSRRRS